MILFRLGPAFSWGFSSVWLRAVISDRFLCSEFASFRRAQLEFSFFLFLSKTPWPWEVKSRKFQLVPLTVGGEIAKILSSSIDDSLSAWIGLLDGIRIWTLVNLLYLRIGDNHWNYVNFETLETHCNLFLTISRASWNIKLSSWIKTLELCRTL